MSEIRCPICQKPSRPSDAHFPFCSKRCKLIDLGAWLEGRYRLSRPLGPGERPGREADSVEGPPAAGEDEGEVEETDHGLPAGVGAGGRANPRSVRESGRRCPRRVGGR